MGGTSLSGFWATSSQDALFYVLLLGIPHLMLYYRRYREREQSDRRFLQLEIRDDGPGVDRDHEENATSGT